MAQEPLHVAILAKVERLHLELDVATCELGRELPRKEIRILAGYENREAALGPKLVDDLLEAIDVLHLVDKQVFHPRRPQAGARSAPRAARAS